jgi:hypothetical protein
MLLSRFAWSVNFGHERETNRGGHDVRRRASPQFSATRLDTDYEKSHNL